MKLIVGLGNPGDEYSNTRHNLGFIILDNYLNYRNLHTFKSNFNSNFIKDNDIFFQKPLTYMNNSGQAISELMKYYKIKPEDLYVIYDDMDMEVGKIRIKNSGSSGGHNGIKSIIAHCGDNFNRIKVGIGHKKAEAIGHVLGKFSTEELEIIQAKFSLFNSLINDIINDMSFEKLRNKYSGKGFNEKKKK
ncbi:aminoacyl-tRNA hydrolase [Sneathia sanguinegens]|jgi:hypothetical protein|uniref:Peptidyl-tRNA hydrolase n=1 Tax=Sneathia sanguinegens TaxID=40543 RepID=A0ABT7HHX8_9FUSO|nr:aminoacyl-tRNA hydrolase [Sneathia sanguinegens]MDK9580118.1 aminoacyl-tRNA hydrolase [Sneathia sanguinegens]